MKSFTPTKGGFVRSAIRLGYRRLSIRGITAALAAGAVILLMAGCRPPRPTPPTPPPPAVTVIRPVSYPVQAYYEYNGYLEAVESAQIKARVRGFLTDVLFTEGADVKEGDLLFKIDSREYVAAVKRADGDRLKALAELRRAKAEEERSKPLVAARNLSVEEFQQRIAARETAEAAIKQSEALHELAQLDLSYTEIKAPIDGRISRAIVTRGNLVGQGEATLLTTIVPVDSLFVWFDVPERDLPEYLQIMQAGNGVARVEIGVADEEGYPHSGFIDFRENRGEPGTGTIRIRGRIDNPPVGPKQIRRLYPGLYARVRVPRGEPKLQLTIPEEALMAGQEGRFVYVLNDQNVVAKRTVSVGPQVWTLPPPEKSSAPIPIPILIPVLIPIPIPIPIPHWQLTNPNPPTEGDQARTRLTIRSVVAIDKGLTAGDRVIVNGLQKARPGAPVTPAEWEFKPPSGKE